MAPILNQASNAITRFLNADGWPLVLAKWAWLEDLFSKVDKNQTIAYVVLGFCVLLILFFLLAIVREIVELPNNQSKGLGYRPLIRVIISSAIGLSALVTVAWEIGKRLFN